jgi:TonB-linked SusC/RagA family outer membrane protein
MFAEYQIIKGLAFKTTLNLDNTDNNSKGYVPYTIAGNVERRLGTDYLTLPSGSFSTFRRQTFVNENTLSYNKVYKDVHDVSFLAGASYNSDRLDRSEERSQNGYSNSIVTTLNSAAAIVGNTTETKNILLSYFGRLQYGYNDKYLFSASIRRDGSSRFGDNTKWGWFPSASVAWRVSQEEFMNNFPQISDLKLRASWGKSGNYNVGDYSAQAVMDPDNYTFGGGRAYGLAPARIVNPDLSWEKSESFDVGVDVGIWKNRLTASFDYYNKLNTDLLLNVPIPGITGFNTMLSNVGKARNQGWEVELTSRNTVGKLQWTTTANFSHNTNKVVALGEGQTQILIPSAFDISHSILRVGEPMNSIYVVHQDGILTQEDIDKGAALYGSQTVGDPRYVDANSDKVIDANDRVIVGHPNPDYVWGVTNNLRYKGFDLSVLVQGQWGGSIYSLFGRAVGRTGQGFTDNALGFFRDRWRSEADPGAGSVGKAYSTFGRIKNTDWLYASDYVRVRNISLGYDLGQLIKGKTVSGARIYATAENFFGFDKYKGGFNPEATNTDVSGSSNYPEAGDYGGLPLPRSLILGVNFTF